VSCRRKHSPLAEATKSANSKLSSAGIFSKGFLTKDTLYENNQISAQPKSPRIHLTSSSMTRVKVKTLLLASLTNFPSYPNEKEYHLTPILKNLYLGLAKQKIAVKSSILTVQSTKQ